MEKIPQAIYHIFVDRFSTGDEERDRILSERHTIKELEDYGQSFLGGNLKGIIKRFDYIKELGVDAVWISPIYKTSAYHGYHVTDFFSIDERFGTVEDLRELIKIFHQNNIKIIFDFIPNHCSSQHPFFIDSQNNFNSKYRDWFIYKKWPGKYLCFLDFSELPKLNLYNNECQHYILEAAKYWIKEFNIDGYRIDHAIGPPLFFWKKLREEVEEIKRDFILIPEIWFSGIKWKHLETLYFLHRKNGKINFLLLAEIIFKNDQAKQNIACRKLEPYFDAMLDFAASDFLRKNYQNKETVESFVKNRESLFGKNNYIFLDNHDMSRFIFLCQNKLKYYKKGLKLFFSLRKPIVIYYGDEIGLRQKDCSIHKSHQDKEFRRFMKWEINKKEEKILNLVKRKIKINKD